MSPSQATACRVCAGQAVYLWSGELLDISVAYYRCEACGYVQTEKPHWLERAYASAINDSDTGIMVRNNHNLRVVLATLLAVGAWGGRVVDCAGGYGLLVRMLRDAGIPAVWADRYCQNLFAKGFVHDGGAADLVTAFEAFEHFEDPGAELDRMLAIAPNVLLSTEIIPEPVPAQDAWWYYGKEHAQHIGFFTVRSLQLMAERRGKTLLTDGRSYHLFTSSPRARQLWPWCLRLLRFMPLLARKTLQSKMWSDNALMGGKGMDS